MVRQNNNVQNLVIEDGVEIISAHAFENCKQLKILMIPESVKTIGNLAFSICGRNIFWCLDDGILI